MSEVRTVRDAFAKGNRHVVYCFLIIIGRVSRVVNVRQQTSVENIAAKYEFGVSHDV